MQTLTEAYNEMKTEGVEFDRVTTGVRVNKHSSTISVRFWKGAQIVRKFLVQSTENVPFVRRTIIGHTRAAFPDKIIDGE